MSEKKRKPNQIEKDRDLDRERERRKYVYYQDAKLVVACFEIYSNE